MGPESEWPAISEPSGPLTGIKVVDLSSVMMGPLAAQIMGDLGADVIKIEPISGDVSRHIPPVPHPGLGATSLMLNRNKRTIAVDLSVERGRAVAMRLMASADILVTNLRPSSLDRLGMSYDTVAALNPGLIYCRGTGFRSDSEHADRPAYDDIVQAMAGSVDLNRRLTGEANFVGTVLADKVAGLTMLYSSLAALVSRSTTGRGQLVEVPMVDVLYAFNMVEHLAGQTFDPPEGTVGYGRALSRSRRPWPTSDGELCMLPYSDQNWRAFFEFAGSPDLAADPRFATMKARSVNIDALYALAMEHAKLKDTAQWLALCEREGIAAAPVMDLDESFADPYLSELVESSTHPLVGSVRWIRHPVRYGSGLDGRRPCMPPGHDSRSILTALGVSAEEVDSMVADGILGET